MSPQQFEQYRSALERVVKEQIANIAKFNLVRASEDLDSYRPHCVPVSGESIDGALEWLSKLDRCAAISPTATCEAILKACSDRHVEAIYLFTEGSACEGAKELLKEKLTGITVPVHVVSYNCTKPDTIGFLKDLSRITGGRFHAYAVTMEMDSYEGEKVDSDTNQANIILKKKTYGGVPPGAGMREDVILLFEELEEARNNLAQIQGLLTEMPEKNIDKSASDSDPTNNETYMSSREWLDRHGLKSKRLGFYDILAGVAFKHQDGVVDIKHAPADDEYQTDAVTKQKLVNAKYCDKFPHVRWKDGQVVHVQVTPEIHRNYEQRMMLALESVQQRIDWLQQGSRELFGTVIEDQIYILIDTSASMAPHIQFVKDKVFVLMQEQLRHKQKFNLVAFNSRAHSWKDRLVEVNEKNLQGAWQWIKSLQCMGSTNSLAALRLALSDPSTQAIYLLSDGRPDQPPKSILAQVMLHPQVPVHTISFNCADKDANEFLCQLAKDTAGRYHYYSENGVEVQGPEPWESEDIRLLRQELISGYRNLEKIAMLRDECAELSWKKEEKTRCPRGESITAQKSAQPPLDPSLLYRGDIERPQSALGFRHDAQPPRGSPRPATVHGFRPLSARAQRHNNVLRPHGSRSPRMPRARTKSQPIRPTTAKSYHAYRPLTAAATDLMQPKKNIAGHTRTSILRTLTSSGAYDKPQWLLPETQDLFDRQWARQQQVTDTGPQSGKKKRTGKKSKRNENTPDSPQPMSSRKWLGHHGLVARKLTILDALAPTFIPHKSRYIPIIDKRVSSKVYDDIMPIGHVAGDKVNIVNPLAVNLDNYIGKVETAVEKYKMRLDKLVWDSLPTDAKSKYNGEGPASFIENKLKLMQDLDESGWPVSERDIILMENEVKQGEIYIQQAKDLQEAAKNRGKGLECENPDDYDEAASVASAASGKQYEGMGDAIGAKAYNKDKTKQITKHRMKKTLDVLRGQKIIGRNEIDGFYYPGYVIKCPDSRHALVEYDEIGQQTIPTRFVIPTSGAIARPPIRVGDYVLSRVVNQDTGLECYVPGIVIVTPKRLADQAQFFTVSMYTTQEEHFLRSYLVKISKMRYMFLVRYIEEINNKKENDDNRSRSSRSSHSRSRSRSSSGSRSRSRSISPSSFRSRHSSRSRSRSSSRSSNGNSGNDHKDYDKRKKNLKKWHKHLEKQQRNHEKQQKKLRQKAKKLAQLKRRLEKVSKGNGKTKEEHQKLLKIIVDELNENQKSRSTYSSSESRTRNWVSTHKDVPHDEAVLQSAGHIGSKQPDQTPFILEMRHSLSQIREGEEVLARWSDEGWYYRGTIKESMDNGAYLMEDSTGTLEKIWREDIIADNDDADVPLQPKDAVIALHPSYAFSYAPGVILEVTSDLRITVRFYDGEEGELPREEVYRVPEEKFDNDVGYIINREAMWVGAPVVARNDETGIYQLGMIQERIGNGRQYTIKWSDNTQSIQTSGHIFGAFTKSHALHVGDRVLAIADPETLTYLPGWVTSRNGDKLAVKFCDSSSSNKVDPRLSCFWLSQEYYDSAVSFYKIKHA